MNFLFLSPNFPQHNENFCYHLKKSGFRVLGIGDEDVCSISSGLFRTLDWYCNVSDLRDYDQVLRSTGFLISKFGRIDKVESLNEFWLETEAGLRTDFNVPGIKRDGVLAVRRKSAMKEIFTRNGIPCAKGRLVRDINGARELVKEVGFPVVVKPDGGVGAMMARKLFSHEDMADFFARKPDVDFIMEEFLEGDTVTFDGLTNRNGDIMFCTSHVYDRPVLDAATEHTGLYYYSVREIPQALESLGRRVVAAFDLKEKFFHIEFIRRKDGSYFAMEINMRPPGGATMDMFNFSCDFDMYEIWAQLMGGHIASINYERKYFVCYIGRMDALPYRHSNHAIIEKYGKLVSWHGRLAGLFRPLMGDYSYIIRSPDFKEMMSAVDFIREMKHAR